MRINKFIVDPGQEDHIARHNVTVVEAEEVVYGTPAVYRERENRYRLVGQTGAGRYLTVFVVPRGGGVYTLVTARDATEAERRRLRAERRR